MSSMRAVLIQLCCLALRISALKLPSLQPSESCSTSSAKIPNTIFMAGPWYPESSVNHNRHYVPGDTQFRYFNYAQVEASIEEISEKFEECTGVKDIGVAFKSLRPMAFRIDLWRLLMLWEYGGVYYDCNVEMLTNLSTWIDADKDDFVACQQEFGYVQNKVFASRPRHPLLVALVQNIVEHTKSLYYRPQGRVPYPEVFITGPGNMRQTIDHSGIHPHINCETYDSRLFYLLPDRTPLFRTNHQLHDAMHTCSTCNNYHYAYAMHSVYCDEIPRMKVKEYDPCENSTSLRANAKKRIGFWKRKRTLDDRD